MMSTQRYEIEAWAGDPAQYASPEQYAQVVDEILASGATDEADWVAIMERVTGALSVTDRAAEVLRARVLLDGAQQRLRATIRQAIAAGMSEVEAARLAGVTRMTVRAWLGKR